MKDRELLFWIKVIFATSLGTILGGFVAQGLLLFIEMEGI